MWLVLLFLARPYAIFLISVANRRDRMGVLKIFYDEPSMGLLGALAAIPAVIVALTWVKRQPGAPAIAERVWRLGRPLLIMSGLMNIAIILMPYLAGATRHITVISWVEAAACILIITYLARSQRVKDTFADFPPPDAGKGNSR